MSGFLKASLNAEFEYGLFENIIDKIIICSQMMKNVCVSNGYRIDNDEQKIRNHLLEKYLNNDEIRSQIGLNDLCLRFIPEVPENYNDSNDTYIGRIDIKVVTENWFKNSNEYYTVECKRVDGSRGLNEKYITEGVSRFIKAPIKYQSYYKRNIMFGFVVKNIDIDSNIIMIEEYHSLQLKDWIMEGLHLLKNSPSDYCLYSSYYFFDQSTLELQHLFFNFSEILCI
jgi:hypothetical protein